MRTIRICLLGLAVCASTNANAQLSADALDDVRSDITAARATEKTLEQQAGDARKRAQSVSQQLVQAAASVQQAEAELDGLEAVIATTRTEEAEKASALANRADNLKASLAALARIARQPDSGAAGAMISGTGPLIDRLRSAGLLSQLTPALRAQMELLGTELNALATLRAELESQRAVRAKALAGLGQKQAALDELLRERKLETAALRAKQMDEQAHIKQLTKRAANLEQLIDALQSQASIVRPVPRPLVHGAILTVRPVPKPGAKYAAAPAVAAPAPQPVATNPPKAAPFAPAIAFTSQKGQLRLPAQGKIIRGYGTKGALGDRGIELAVRSGAQVITPVDAQILFAGPFRSYGGLIILSVGGGYHLLVVGIDQIDAVAGQKLIAGEPVGRLANGVKSGMVQPENRGLGGLDQRLYVELRRNGKPLNPVPWLKGAK